MHSSYKLTKKKNISCIYHYTIINIIIDRYRSFQRRGSERFPVPKKKKSGATFRKRRRVSYQRRTFSRRILFDPRVKRRSTRHIHEGKNEFSPGTKRGSHNLLLLIFLVLPPLFPLAQPSSSTLHLRDNTHIAQEGRKIVAGIEIKLFPRLSRRYLASDLERGLRPRFGYFIGVFRIDLVGGR